MEGGSFRQIPRTEPRCQIFDPLKHNYYKKLVKLVDEGKIPRACLSQVDVYHDDWCRIHRGDYCNCDPDIIVWPPPERN